MHFWLAVICQDHALGEKQRNGNGISEILIDRGWDFDKPFENQLGGDNRPRRLTPMECARLMGFAQSGSNHFRIPVSDTQAYKQFGNSVVVPVFEAVAKMMAPRISAGSAVINTSGRGKAA